jgi:hypothetical protein
MQHQAVLVAVVAVVALVEQELQDKVLLAAMVVEQELQDKVAAAVALVP